MASAERLFVIEGHGYGHGVGMSQSGAEGFAAHGYRHDQILGHYYPGTKVARVPRTARIRVLLADRRSAVVVHSAAPISLTDAAGRSMLLPAGSYRLDSTMAVRAGGGYVRPRPPVRLEPTVQPLALDGNAFRGALLIARDAAGLSVVNDLPIDLYVRGVVAWEMPASWRVEALKAQAVAARSYALAAVRRDRSFDVYPDQRSQMYGGVRAELASTNRAVEATSGEVLVWEGRVATTFFSSSSGGRTAAAGDVWPGGRSPAYLRSVPDPYDTVSPQHHWGPLLLSAATLSGRLGIANIQGVRTTLNGSQRVAALTIAAADGVHVLSGGEVARALGLRSTWFSIRPSGVGGVFPGPPHRPTPVRKRRAHRQEPAPPVTVARRRARAATATPIKREHDVPALEERLAVAALLLILALALSRPPGRLRPGAGRAVALLAGVSASAAAGAIVVTAVLSREQTVANGGGGHPLARTTTAPAPAVRSNASPPRPAEAVVARLPSLPAPVPVRGVLQWQTESTAAPPVAGQHARAERRTAAPAWTQVEPPPSEPAQPAPALTISGVRILASSSSAARIGWSTSHLAATQGARGFALTPTVWTAPEAPSLEHETSLSGLDPATTYSIWLQAIDAWGQTSTAMLTLSTPLLTGQQRSRADGDTILLDEQPFFPRMLWATCRHELPEKIEQGINLFMGNGCGEDSQLFEALGGRAVAVVGSATGQTSGDGLIGWYYPDEWDEHLPGRMAAADLSRLVERPPPGILSFLTLTNHFYSRAEPLPQGRGIYDSLVQLPDVIGFDIYPLQIWCRDDRFTDIYDAQRELDQLTLTKPAFQWIEVRAMQCAGEHLRPQADTVRAETWLAIAGGADGIGYFPNEWTPEVGAEITRTNSELEELAAALLADPASAASESAHLRVAARVLNGALYIIAVNATRTPVDAAIQVPGLGGRVVEAFGENRSLTPSGDSFNDHFDPLGVHIYLAAPVTWDRTATANALVARANSAHDGQQAQDDEVGKLDDEHGVPAGAPLMW